MFRTSLLLVLAFVASNVTADEKSKTNVKFRKFRLDAKFRSEGVAVGDFNKDGKLDIAAGYVWYEAPTWKMHPILAKTPNYKPKGYSNSFANFAHDVNGDGWTDLLVVDFPGTPTWWFENPKNAKKPWKRHTCTPVSNNESPVLLDLDGDGKKELVVAFSPDPKKPDGPDRRMAFIKPRKDAYAQWKIYPISAKAAPGTRKYSHGLGVGDVNKDGRNDILCGSGWWEAPRKELQTRGEWKFHPAPFGKRSAQMYVYDFDGDGDNDVLSSSPHNYGVRWHEQQKNGDWKTHIIDKSYSQTHGVCFADINGDGLMDFVTGKRWWAHNGSDPGGNDPAVFFWYELRRKGGKATWIRHQFDHASGPGTQFELADVNGDGLIDVVTSNKKGVHYFQQSRD